MSTTTYDNIATIDGDNMGEATEDGFSTSMLTFAAVMTLMIMIVGIFGNFLTVAALIKCPKVRNVAAAFIMSLCIADLLFCALVLPFSAFRFIQGTWEPRDVLCKMIPFIQYGNIGVSLLCIAMITINRYVMIAHHSSYGKIYKRHWIAAMIVFCWVFSYGMQLPTLVGAWGTFDYDPKLGTCSIRADDHGRSSKTTLFVTAFVIPCLIIIACYAKIFWVVHTSEQRLKRHANKQNSIPNNLRPAPSTGSNAGTGNGQSRVSSADSSSFSTDVKQESVQKQPTSRIKDQREVRAKRNEWRITKMVLAIFLSFVVCYLPITIAKVADQDVEHPNLHILSYIMLYLSACLNPIIYVIMNKQYRKAYKTVIMCEPSRLLPFGKHGGGGQGGAGSSAAEMERYRIEPQPQSHYGLANVGSGPAKYQLQQFRPTASYRVDTQNSHGHERQYNKYDGSNDGGAGASASASLYREHERNGEKRDTTSASVNNERTISHAYSDQQQQQQSADQWEQHDATHHQRDQSHSPSGRRYHFGRGGRGRAGGDGGSASTEDGEPYGAAAVRSTTTTTTTRPDHDSSRSHHATRASVRERECVAPEEKPILRSEHKRHSR